MESTLPVKLTTLSLLARMMSNPSLYESEPGAISRAFTLGRSALSICLAGKTEQIVEPLGEMLVTISQCRISDSPNFVSILSSCDKLAQHLDALDNA